MTTANLFPFNHPLIPVRDLQKNATKQFQKGLVRVTKNGKSLGYVISDEMMEKILEDIEASNSHFVAKMEKVRQTKKRIPLEEVLKEYGLND